MNDREAVLYAIVSAIADVAKNAPDTPLSKIMVVHHGPGHIGCVTIPVVVAAQAAVNITERDFS